MKSVTARFIGGSLDGQIKIIVGVPIYRHIKMKPFHMQDWEYSSPNLQYDIEEYFRLRLGEDSIWVYSIWKTPRKILALEVFIPYINLLKWGPNCITAIYREVKEYAKENNLSITKYYSNEHSGYVYQMKPVDSKIEIQNY